MQESDFILEWAFASSDNRELWLGATTQNGITMFVDGSSKNSGFTLPYATAPDTRVSRH